MSKKGFGIVYPRKYGQLILYNRSPKTKQHFEQFGKKRCAKCKKQYPVLGKYCVKCWNALEKRKSKGA